MSEADESDESETPIIPHKEPAIGRGEAEAARQPNPLQRFLKILANSTSYGIYFQLDVKDLPKREGMRCYGPDGQPFPIELATFEEGCLSVPEIYEEVERAARIKAEFVDREGTKQLLEADGLLATCLQHEMDHLEGVLFIDHLSKLKRSIALRKLQKAKRLKETG